MSTAWDLAAMDYFDLLAAFGIPVTGYGEFRRPMDDDTRAKAWANLSREERANIATAQARAAIWAEQDQKVKDIREAAAAVARERRAAEWTPERIREVMASVRPS